MILKFKHTLLYHLIEIWEIREGWIGHWNIYLSHRIYYRQLSADFKHKNYKIKNSFVSPEGPKAWFNKFGMNFNILIFKFVKNCM